MTFENQGEWHLDHRKPVAEFRREVEAGTISLEDAAAQCNHFTNFQPMWGRENESKNAMHDPDTFRYFWDPEAGYLGKVQ